MSYWILILTLSVHLSLFSQEYDIRSYGAVGDGMTINTVAIQNAIDIAHAHGGGKVIIPKGIYVSGSLEMKSNVELHLKKRATLLGSPFPEDYRNVYKWKALLLADGVENISITGKGVIDGRGAELGLRIDSLFYAGQIDSHHYHLAERRAWHELRPQLIEFYRCHNIKIINVIMKNSSSWVQTYEKCSDLIMDHLTIDSDAYWNNDGIDIVDCKNVRITNCNINASDDGICLKSEDFDLVHINENIYIADCKIRSSSCAIKFGTSLVSGTRNVVIRNIEVYDTYRSAIAIEATQGGFIEDVLVENIRARNTGNAIFLRIGRVRGAEKAGPLRNVTIRNMHVTIPFNAPDLEYEIRGPALPFFHNVFPSSITGNPGVYVENVNIENITIDYPGRGNPAYAHMPLYRIKDVPELETTYPEFSMFGELPAWGFYVRHVKGLRFKNIDLKIRKPDYRPAMVFDDVHDLEIYSLTVRGDNKAEPLFFKDCSNVKYRDLKINLKK